MAKIKYKAKKEQITKINTFIFHITLMIKERNEFLALRITKDGKF